MLYEYRITVFTFDSTSITDHILKFPSSVGQVDETNKPQDSIDNELSRRRDSTVYHYSSVSFPPSLTSQFSFFFYSEEESQESGRIKVG